MDERFHVVEIALERFSTGGSESILGAGHPPLERFGAGNVRGLFQLAGVDAEVAVGGIEQFLQLIESERLVDGKRAQNAQTKPFVDESVELGRGEGCRNTDGRRV